MASTDSVLDPDIRFLLANERTVLAWVRTSLALQASGVGVLDFVRDFGLNAAVGIFLILLGVLAAGAGFVRYRAADGAIRQGRLPPRGVGPQALTIAVTLLAVLLLGVAIGHQFG